MSAAPLLLAAGCQAAGYWGRGGDLALHRQPNAAGGGDQACEAPHSPQHHPGAHHMGGMLLLLLLHSPTLLCMLCEWISFDALSCHGLQLALGEMYVLTTQQFGAMCVMFL